VVLISLQIFQPLSWGILFAKLQITTLKHSFDNVCDVPIPRKILLKFKSQDIFRKGRFYFFDPDFKWEALSIKIISSALILNIVQHSNRCQKVLLWGSLYFISWIVNIYFLPHWIQPCHKQSHWRKTFIFLTKNRTHCMQTFRCIHLFWGVLPLFTCGTPDYMC